MNNKKKLIKKITKYCKAKEENEIYGESNIYLPKVSKYKNDLLLNEMESEHLITIYRKPFRIDVHSPCFTYFKNKRASWWAKWLPNIFAYILSLAAIIISVISLSTQ